MTDGAVVGATCERCGFSTAPATPRCPSCGGPSRAAAFAPRGTVWASTVIHIPVGERLPPFGLAYIDLEDGPRILAHFADATPLRIGEKVSFAQVGEDLVVER